MAKYPHGLQDMVPGFCICTDRQAGVVTDDTQMAYCLHLALQDANGWSRDAALKRYLEWLSADPPDIGEATYDALTGNPNPESQGNGALMRVLPIALWAASHPDFDWRSAVREDAAIAGALLGAWKGITSIPRPWLAAVHAANPACYTSLLPAVDAVPAYPRVFCTVPRKKYAYHRLGGVAPVSRGLD